jgi:AraC family transcriptional regulator, regulatory protein of adaptative response / methylated-DNA-[protein]-cysteine methyltransferase
MNQLVMVPVAKTLKFDGDERWQAVMQRDVARDGEFVYAVTSTGIFCRPSCPSRRPLRERVRFFMDAGEAAKAGFRACMRCKPMEAASAKMQEICRWIDEHLEEPVTLEALAAKFGGSPWHLQRSFKKAIGVSPREYAESRRMQTLKNSLQAGSSVTDAVYEAGFGSPSRVYERTASHLGMTPGRYQRGGEGMVIGYMAVDSPVGKMLVAATDKGVCSITLGESEGKLIEALKKEYPQAKVQRSTAILQRWVSALLAQMVGGERSEELPLDIKATAFQRLVWKHLQAIPYGKTKSYAEIATEIGQPTATRAVARACATNPVAIAIPCHRVISKSGETGGYRWGVERKGKLLEMEAAVKN